MHYFSFNISDYNSATAHLTNDEDLAYRRLLSFYYDKEAPIPLETQQVARRLRLGSELVLTVLKEFFTETPDGWRNERCDAEIAEYHRKAEISRNNGKLGGRKKLLKNQKDKEIKTQQVPASILLDTQQEPDSPLFGHNQELRTNNYEPISITPPTPPGGKRTRASRLPDDLTPNQTAIDLAKRINVDLDSEFLAFKDHALANGKTFSDWQAAIRTWLNNSVKFNKVNGAVLNGRERKDNDFRNTEKLFERTRNARQSDRTVVCENEGVIRLEDELGIFR
jgi:uncharacterized protein YdaU (DUF1376 family)